MCTPRRLLLVVIISVYCITTYAQRAMEWLDRGVVAVRNTDGSVFVSWRLLGTEPDNISFNLYRSKGSGKLQKLNLKPITGATNFIDSDKDTTQPRSYIVKAIM